MPRRVVRDRALRAPGGGDPPPVSRPPEGLMSNEGAASPPPERPLAKDAMWHFLNLAVLWTFAVAQPLFDLLGDNPEFFAARGSSGFDIISFSVLLVALPPLLLLGIELLFSLAGRRAFRAVHLVFLAALVTLIAGQALKK